VQTVGVIGSAELLCAVVREECGRLKVVSGDLEIAEINGQHVVARKLHCCENGAAGAEPDQEVGRWSGWVWAIKCTATLEIAERDEVDWEIFGEICLVHVVRGRQAGQAAFVG